MGAPSSRSFVRGIVWTVACAAFVVVMAVGVAARVNAPQVWVLLVALPLAAAGLMRMLLTHWFAPLSELRLLVARAREAKTSLALDLPRYGLFADLAQAAMLTSERYSVKPVVKVIDPSGADQSAFLRSVSHELRTPLNAILGFADVLLNELDGDITRDQRENLTIIRESGQRLSLLVTDMIDVASLTSGDSLRVRAALDMGELLDVVREAALERRGMRPVHVRVDVAEGATTIVSERETLLRALRIVVEHVLELTQSGEVSIVCTREDQVCMLRLHGDDLAQADEELRGLVEDETSDDKKPKAARLRLAIAKELFSLLGARADVVTDEQGTAIAVRLPVGETR